jgi:hypothetical protein
MILTISRTRNKAVAIAIMGNWLSNFVVVMITPLGLEELNYKFYIIWAIFCCSFAPIVYFLYPETARKSLEEIDIEFRESPGILRGRFRRSETIRSVENIVKENDSGVSAAEMKTTAEEKFYTELD